MNNRWRRIQRLRAQHYWNEYGKGDKGHAVISKRRTRMMLKQLTESANDVHLKPREMDDLGKALVGQDDGLNADFIATIETLRKNWMGW